MSKTIEEIEKEAEEFAYEIIPYRQFDPDTVRDLKADDLKRNLIKLGYMRAYNVMQSDTPLVSLSKRD